MNKNIITLIHNGFFYLKDYDPEDLLGKFDKAGITKTDLDRAAGYDTRMFSTFERGERRISPERYRRYLEVLEVGVFVQIIKKKSGPNKKTGATVAAKKVEPQKHVFKKPRKLTEKQRRFYRARKLFVDNFILEWNYQECVG